MDVINNNNLIPAEGKWLCNSDGTVYSKEVWLGINDSVDNWHEIDESEVPKDFLNLI